MKAEFLMGKFFKKAATHFRDESVHHKTMSAGWSEDSEQHGSHVDRADACTKLSAMCQSIGEKCDKGESNRRDLEKLFGDKRATN